MESSRSGPWRSLPVFEDADRLWDTFVERMAFADPFGVAAFNSPRAMQWGRRPRVDVAERDDALLVTAELPGLKTEDLDVSVTNDVVTLRATQAEERAADEGTFHRREIIHGSFVRHVRLPCGVDADHATATYRDGILKLTLPKTKQERTRKIALSTDTESTGPERTNRNTTSSKEAS